MFNSVSVTVENSGGTCNFLGLFFFNFNIFHYVQK